MTDQDREFSLVDLAPEPLIFTDSAFGGDGTRHEVRTFVMFSPAEIGMLRRLGIEIDQLEKSSQTLFTDPASSDDALNQAGAQLERAHDTMLRLLMPSLPAERLQKIPFIGKQQIIAWWNSQVKAAQRGAPGGPLARSGAPPTRRGKRSPSSVTPTPA
jgi:hypothetical protein